MLLVAVWSWQAHSAASAGPTTVDFSISTDNSLGAKNTCNTTGSPTTVCEVPLNANFKVSVNLNTLDSGLANGKYFGYSASLAYSGVGQAGTAGSLNSSPWPECVFYSFGFGPGNAYTGCVVGLASSGSTYTGRLETVEFTCVQDGQITLLHGPSDSSLLDSEAVFYEPEPSESLTINCVDQVDFSARVEAGPDVLSACDSAGYPTAVCTIRAGATFLLHVRLHQFPSTFNGGYEGFDAMLQYSGVTSAETPQSVDFSPWATCGTSGGASFFSSHIYLSCIPDVSSTHIGDMATAALTCAADGTVSMIHGFGDTDLFDHPFFVSDPDATESLTIDCADPQPYPADTDGDGCPDAREQGTNQMMGGQRDYFSRWDYFNPTHDGQNRIDDVLAVVDQYFIDQGEPLYTQDTDRTFIGPSLWKVGPPDGKQRIDDVVNAVHQYYHDCS
jgi:hypothetical protein